MKIPFGSLREKALLAGGFLTAAALALTVLWRYDLYRQPYLRLPLLLACGALIPFVPPGTLLRRSAAWRLLYRASPVLLLMVAISTASSFSFATDDSLSVSDSLFHSGEFLALGLLMARWAEPLPERSGRALPVLLVLAVLAVFAGLDEWHQAFVPGRDPSLRDIGSDLLGGAAGILAYRLLAPRVFGPGPGAGEPGGREITNPGPR